jgi:glycosyltransferase involved in cell wall biosynthesis
MRLTIVCPSAYPILVPTDIPFAGGAEFQLLMLGRALRARGHDVSWVVADHGQPEEMEADGFRLHRAFELYKGNRKLRFAADMWKLRRALRRSRPDIVNQRSTSFYTGQCCFFSHEVGAAFVFSLGIDYNAYPDLLGRGPWMIQKLYAWGIRNAELVLAQTEEQGQRMQENFGRATEVLPNMLELPPERRDEEIEGYVLWVGSLAKRKRPELFVDLAARLPQFRFKLVGGPGEDRGYDEEIRRRAQPLENLEFVGFVPPAQMDRMYRGAALYVNTSRLEGLPNAFLQAWSHGVPTLTMSVDPDGVIAGKELGLVGDDPPVLAAHVTRMMEDDGFRTACGRRARQHVADRHDVRVLGARAEELFLAARKGRSRA